MLILIPSRPQQNRPSFYLPLLTTLYLYPKNYLFLSIINLSRPEKLILSHNQVKLKYEVTLFQKNKFPNGSTITLTRDRGLISLLERTDYKWKSYVSVLV